MVAVLEVTEKRKIQNRRKCSTYYQKIRNDPKRWAEYLLKRRATRAAYVRKRYALSEEIRAKSNAASKRWRNKNRSAAIIACKRWSEANKDRIKANRNAWRDNNREHVRAYNMKKVYQKKYGHPKMVATALLVYQLKKKARSYEQKQDNDK